MSGKERRVLGLEHSTAGEERANTIFTFFLKRLLWDGSDKSVIWDCGEMSNQMSAFVLQTFLFILSPPSLQEGYNG